MRTATTRYFSKLRLVTCPAKFRVHHPRMASEQDINKRLRSLHQDFDFLLDNNVISADLYDELVQRIPRRNNSLVK
jgi:hypothetical protein